MPKGISILNEWNGNGADSHADAGGMRRMAASVILAAIDDVAAQTRNARVSARLFLTDIGGAWGKSRAMWCDIADIHEGALMVAAEKAIAAAPPLKPKETKPRVRKSAATDTEVRIAA